ncbi:hypothetical protein CH64_432 [Yersinia rohdei]|uniref:Phage protein n=1 Tax=Yersinia rohdei TaxID=29485 RepID=A0A0U1HSR0_YERRO|nr:hypothetical protein [Yersinia rohdei]AJJ11218.1 hypothetical protein CH64_432 [Yersinia rohdei]EEQ02409.1 hypothetical protein yrohd0001_33240 [Yersinia rohdei ATCC 43380]MDN0093486.1 hypothetical protein [Yersinia rohdei]OWF80841.1 hypothetical protein B4900_05465 [Yersinia rohdei]CND98306.1 phage protein [Yersinia rohdei]
MKSSTLAAVIIGLSATLGSISHQVQAAGASLINLDCQLKDGNNLTAVLDGPNQQLIVDKSVFKFIQVNPEGKGESLIFQKVDSQEPIIASLNISGLPIRLALVDGEQANHYTCTHTTA